MCANNVLQAWSIPHGLCHIDVCQMMIIKSLLARCVITSAGLNHIAVMPSV